MEKIFIVICLAIVCDASIEKKVHVGKIILYAFYTYIVSFQVNFTINRNNLT